MLEIKDLVKHYKKFIAVDGLNLTILKGEIFGFVGPNGAGKTTTIRMICGLLRPTCGIIELEGEDITKDSTKAKEKIGFMPDFFGVYDNLKVCEYLEFYSSIYGIVGKDFNKKCDDLLELVDLKNKKNDYVDHLSRGMKQRLCLARSLVHDPKLLVLDEPASGMDPRARYDMKEILKNLKDLGKTIIISSHILTELSQVCTDIGIINKGKIVTKGKVQDMIKNMGISREVKLKVLSKYEETEKILKEMPNISNVYFNDDLFTFDFNGNDEELAVLNEVLIHSKIPLLTVAQGERNLEELFMQITENKEAV